VSHNPSLADLRRFNVRNLRGQGVVTAPARIAPALPRTVRAFVATPIVSNANRREHWTKRHGRNTAQHAAVSVAMGNDIIGRGQPKSVLFVVLVAQPMDSDNLAISMKAVRDSIAKLCGFDDSADVWRYSQRRREHYEPGGCFVKVEF
jgi:hypothetical protein